MNTVTDTLASAETLEEAGVPRRQAAHARVVEVGWWAVVADLPTKLDLKVLEVRLLLYGVSSGVLLFVALRFG